VDTSQVENVRQANEGEVCTCGRPARVVFLTPDFGEVPYCGTLTGYGVTD
jgi:hypothetical protein